MVIVDRTANPPRNSTQKPGGQSKHEPRKGHFGSGFKFHPLSPFRCFLVFPLLAAVLLVPLAGIAATPPKEKTIADLIAAEGFKQASARIDSLLAVDALPPTVRTRIILQRALCQKGLGNPAKALPDFEASHEAYPEIGDYLLTWEAECLESLKDPLGASERYKSLLKLYPGSLLKDDIRLRLARFADGENRNLEAIRIFKRVASSARQTGHVAEGLFGLASIQMKLNRKREARKTCLKLMKNHTGKKPSLEALRLFGIPRTSEERYQKGRVYLRHKKWNKAISNFKSLISKHPSDKLVGMAHYLTGRSYFGARRYTKASSTFSKAYRKYGIREALYYFGRCAIRRNKDSLGADRLLKFVARYPRHKNAHNALWYAAWAFERLGDYQKARRTYQRIASGYRKSPNVEQSRFRAAFSLYSSGKIKKAIKAFSSLGESARGYLRDQSFFWVGKCYGKLRDPNTANRWFRRASNQFPTSYYATRAAMTLSTADRKSLVGDALADSDFEPDQKEEAIPPTSQLRKADFLILLGLYTEAGRELRPIQRAHRNKPKVLRAFLRRYERIGSYDRALRVGRRIVDLDHKKDGPLNRIQLRTLYPDYYRDLIRKPAVENRLNPSLVLAIIRQESGFDHGAISRSGARGLMQIMPATGRGWASKMGIRNFKVEDLMNPTTSIRMGCREIASYLRKFPDNFRGRVLSMASYNAGFRSAQRWNRTLPADIDEFVENIPFHETRTYIKLVVRNQEIYNFLETVRMDN